MRRISNASGWTKNSAHRKLKRENGDRKENSGEQIYFLESFNYRLKCRSSLLEFRSLTVGDVALFQFGAFYFNYKAIGNRSTQKFKTPAARS